jgi:beta-glucosidase
VPIDDLTAFGPGFAWGAATSAYQVEGAAAEDGRAPSIWDAFCRVPGAVAGGDTGDVACDHYHRWPEDVALMKALGLRAYRFSIAWPRVLPAGGGPVNPAGLAFYDRLVDALLEAGIEPHATLYHWDLPQALQDRGGWPARDTAARFAEYASAVAGTLGDRVTSWATLNEPICAAWIGHLLGDMAPGVADIRAAVPAAYHLLLAHGLGAQAVRAAAPDARVGIVHLLTDGEPGGDRDEDAAAARREDGHHNRWWLDPVFGRGLPADMIEGYGVEPPVRPGDLEAHLAACASAIRAGVPLDGYFAWSLLDNFEWAYGYAQRFGLVHVDFATQKRVVKDSGHRYAEFIRAHRDLATGAVASGH